MNILFLAALALEAFTSKPLAGTSIAMVYWQWQAGTIHPSTGKSCSEPCQVASGKTFACLASGKHLGLQAWCLTSSSWSLPLVPRHVARVGRCPTWENEDGSGRVPGEHSLKHTS